MMILRKKYYSDENGGMSTGKKVALGLGGLALGFAGARRGMFGNSLAMSSNKLWAKAGQSMGNQGMINSAATNYGNARAATFVKNAKDTGHVGLLNDIKANGGVDALSKKMSNKFANNYSIL